MNTFDTKKEEDYEPKPKIGFWGIIFKIIKFLFILLVLIVMLIMAWLMIKNPLNLRTMILSRIGLEKVKVEEMSDAKEGEKNPLENQAEKEGLKKTVGIEIKTSENQKEKIEIPITEKQKEILKKIGVDPEALPPITPEIVKCLEGKFSEERIQEFIQGALPGPLEIIKAGSCL